MRRIGLQAYQTSLLPHDSPRSISRLNYLPIKELFAEDLPVKAEIERAITVAQPVGSLSQQSLYFVANLMEVMHNVVQWNRDMMNPTIQSLWGKRRITYFVYNPHTKQFAPSKFCAYISVGKQAENNEPDVMGPAMTIPLYVKIPWGEPIFDGHTARRHLENHLAMRLVKLTEIPDLYITFNSWYQQYVNFINAPIESLSILLPPIWY